MRQLLTLIVLAALGYFGYNYYREHGFTLPSSQSKETLPPIAEESGGLPTDPAPATFNARIPAPKTAPADEALPAHPAVPPSQPAFKSKIPLPETARPGDKLVAPPGVYYMTERVSAQTSNGIAAVVPGEEVRVLKRNGSNLRVMHGATEFDVKESQVTNDLNVARQFEKKEFQRRTGQR